MFSNFEKLQINHIIFSRLIISNLPLFLANSTSLKFEHLNIEDPLFDFRPQSDTGSEGKEVKGKGCGREAYSYKFQRISTFSRESDRFLVMKGNIGYIL